MIAKCRLVIPQQLNICFFSFVDTRNIHTKSISLGIRAGNSQRWALYNACYCSLSLKWDELRETRVNTPIHDLADDQCVDQTTVRKTQ
jgi:hypothetical protein